MPQSPQAVYSFQPGGTFAAYNVTPQNVGLDLYRNSAQTSNPRCLYRLIPVALGSAGAITLYDSVNTSIPLAVATMTTSSASIVAVNGFTAGQPVYLTGTVPLPYLVLTQYYVSATGLSNSAFQLSTTLTGTPAVVTGTTGPVGVAPGVVTTFTNASASLAATAHGLTQGQAVTLIGTVPLPYLTNTTYYVSATGLTANAYQLSLTVSGAPLAVTGSTTTVDVATTNHLGNQILTLAYNAASLVLGNPLAYDIGLQNGLVIGAMPTASQYTITLG